ncbi:hypothetical protein BGZ80_006135 [Entomortierella chlamydospora]|uniref:Uncharacterized protein n=1 Tax=Entomortierella chlamydospora TaxID=101097 RepID=A0A9P6STP7_9FUNG|nr:hypothetical protein BGZ80_006135 [Entomortierella chlamydospora]
MKFNTVLFALSAVAAVASATVEVPSVPGVPGVDLTPAVEKRDVPGLGNAGDIAPAALKTIEDAIGGTGVAKRGLINIDANVTAYVKAIVAVFAKIEVEVIAEIVAALVVDLEKLEGLYPAYVKAYIDLHLYASIQAVIAAHVDVGILGLINIDVNAVASVCAEVVINVRVMIEAAIKLALSDVCKDFGIPDVLALAENPDNTIDGILAKDNLANQVKNAVNGISA